MYLIYFYIRDRYIMCYITKDQNNQEKSALSFISRKIKLIDPFLYYYVIYNDHWLNW